MPAGPGRLVCVHHRVPRWLPLYRHNPGPGPAVPATSRRTRGALHPLAPAPAHAGHHCLRRPVDGKPARIPDQTPIPEAKTRACGSLDDFGTSPSRLRLRSETFMSPAIDARPDCPPRYLSGNVSPEPDPGRIPGPGGTVHSAATASSSRSHRARSSIPAKLAAKLLRAICAQVARSHPKAS